MDIKLFKLLIDSIGTSTNENLYGILKGIPKFGNVAGELYKSVKQGIADYKVENAVDIKGAYYQSLIKKIKAKDKPQFMNCVILPSVNAVLFTEEQKQQLYEILNLERESNENTRIIVEFIDKYLEGNAIINEDYEIGNNYISIYFSFAYGNEIYPYEEQPIISFIEAVNHLLEQEIFKDYLIFG